MNAQTQIKSVLITLPTFTPAASAPELNASQIRPAWPRSDRMGKKESQQALRECVRRNPESDLHGLAEKLGWSLGKTNAVIGSMRAEFTQGYVLRSSIKYYA